MITSPSDFVWTSFDEMVPSPKTDLVLQGPSGTFIVDRDGLRIGASPVCELHLPNGPSLHSVIHTQSGVCWIESEDDASLIVNGQPRRRIALRENDVLNLNGVELTVHFQLIGSRDETPHRLEDDLSLLTAEELCDRILSEQSMIEEFTEGQRSGWSDLMKAIEAEHESEHSSVTLPLKIDSKNEDTDGSDNCERLLEQIRELSEMVNGRSQELDDCESELVAATALLEEAQERVSQQIEGLLEQLQTPSVEMELRASA